MTAARHRLLLRRRRAAPVLLLASILSIAAAPWLAGCGGQSQPDKFPDPGHVVVQVNDTLGAGVPGAVCDLDLPDGSLTWRSGTTGATGRVDIASSEGGVLPGSYVLVVKPPAGYALAPGQAASTPVTVTSNVVSPFTVTLAAVPAAEATR
jgi:hypothetical protein